MSLQGWQETLVSSNADGAALASSTSQVSIIPPTALITLPPNYLAVGRTLRITASGRMSTVVTTPGTFTFFVKIGSVNVASSPAFALQTTAQTNDTWRLEWLLTTRAIGSGTNANIMHTGYWCSLAAAGSSSPNAITLLIPLTAPAVGTGFDSTISNIVDFQGQWSVSNAANSITVHQYVLESLN